MIGEADKSRSLSLSINEEFMTVSEVANRYRTSSPMIYRWVAESRFPESVVLRLGRKILIHRKNLEAYEAQGGDLFKRDA
jgi:excisionase family DNA binding protein